MSIDALEYASELSGLPIETCLKMVRDAAIKSCATADAISEAWCFALRQSDSPERALDIVMELFNAGYNTEMIIYGLGLHQMPKIAHKTLFR
jgi:hypothetical protein